MVHVELSRVVDVVERGIRGGLHLGAQVCVSLRGQRASVALGRATAVADMEPGLLLPWFSATKPVTAAAVLQQWERGRLDLDDPVGRHVPEFAAAGKEAVTVRHLLTHTAGFHAHDDGDADGGGGAPWEDAVARACGAPLAEGWVPGRRAAYSARAGYLVLGEVVRRLDGRPFDAYVSEELFEPLGMANSWLALPPERAAAYGARLAPVHDASADPPRPLPPAPAVGDVAYAHPGTSGIGPAGDLLRFYEMLLDKGELDGVRVLAPQTVEAMCARHRAGIRDETFGAVMDWGLGVILNSWHYRRAPAPYGYGNHASPRTFGHGGRQSLVALADPEAGLAAVVVLNGLPGEPAHHRRIQAALDALYEDLGLLA